MQKVKEYLHAFNLAIALGKIQANELKNIPDAVMQLVAIGLDKKKFLSDEHKAVLEIIREYQNNPGLGPAPKAGDIHVTVTEDIKLGIKQYFSAARLEVGARGSLHSSQAIRVLVEQALEPQSGHLDILNMLQRLRTSRQQGPQTPSGV